jgi:hypothetical protein
LHSLTHLHNPPDAAGTAPPPSRFGGRGRVGFLVVISLQLLQFPHPVTEQKHPFGTFA